MRIGELAAECGCSVETIRYYEKVRLLPKPERAENGYRRYTDQQVKSLQFILRCRKVGLTQEEVRQLIGIEMSPTAQCDEVNKLLSEHLVILRHKLSELTQMEKAVLRLKDKCSNGKLDGCPVIAELLE